LKRLQAGWFAGRIEETEGTWASSYRERREVRGFVGQFHLRDTLRPMEYTIGKSACSSEAPSSRNIPRLLFGGARIRRRLVYLIDTTMGFNRVRATS